LEEISQSKSVVVSIVELDKYLSETLLSCQLDPADSGVVGGIIIS